MKKLQTVSVTGDDGPITDDNERITINRKRLAKLCKVTSYIAFILYMILLLFLTLYSREYMRGSSYRGLNMVPFKQILQYMTANNINNDIIITNLLGNIAAFIPMGFLLPLVWKKTDRFFTIILVSLGISFSIEVVQYILAVGAADVDDLILNTFGGIMGYLLLKLISKTASLIIKTTGT